jgi:hypothetical protein
VNVHHAVVSPYAFSFERDIRPKLTALSPQASKGGLPSHFSLVLPSDRFNVEGTSCKHES